MDSSHSKLDTDCGDKSVAMACSNRDSELDSQNLEDKECSESVGDVESVKCSKSDENSHEVNSQSKMDTSFNVRNGEKNIKYNFFKIDVFINLYLLTFL